MKKIRIVIEAKGQQPHDVSFDLPESWDEVPADVYPHLASLYLAGPDKMGPHDKYVRAFAILVWQQWKTLEKLEAEELYDLLKLVTWVFDRLDLTKNHQPVLSIDKEYFGPDDRLANLRFAEWCAADTYFTEYTATQDPQLLSKLAAVLYRPAGEGPEFVDGSPVYRGDKREVYNDQLVEERSELMSALPKPVLQGIYVFFASCRHQILAEYPDAFPPDKKAEGQDGDGWLGVYDDLRSDPKYAGNAERLEEEFLDMVLFSLNRNNIKMKKLKEEYDL